MRIGTNLSGVDLTAQRNLMKAIEILDNASSQVTNARGSAGAFEKYTVESSQNLIDSARSNVSQSLSTIRDTDIAKEVSNLIQAEILFSSSTAALAMAAGGTIRLLSVSNLRSHATFFPTDLPTTFSCLFGSHAVLR